jgi:uncharacterized protein (TIGR03435 family)
MWHSLDMFGRWPLLILVAACYCEAQRFEVVSVKAMKPSDRFITRGRQGGPGTIDPVTFHWGGVSMRSLLMDAYALQWEELIGPAWVTEGPPSNLYVVDAKLAPGATREQFQVMLQNLLKERFHLVVHRETRNFQGYDLIVAPGGSKLKPIGTFEKDAPLPLGQGIYEGRGESMRQIVENLERMLAESLGTGDARPRINNKTGMTGRFDYRVKYECFGGCRSVLPPWLRAKAGAPPALVGAGQPVASDPSGSHDPNILQAVQVQLGLKLVKAKAVPVSVLVVDRVDREPTAN